MSPAPAVPVALTVVFALTGLVSLAEYARAVAAPRAAATVEARAIALLHILMSVAMIAMVWGLVGGPTTASGTVQLLVFGGFALAFALAAARAAARPSRLPRALHAVAALAMVWMVAAMPVLMGSTAPATSAGGHDMAGMDMAGMSGMAGMAGTDGAAGGAPAGPAPGWVLGLTVALVGVLALAAAVWLVAAVRSPARSALAAAACPAAAPTAVPTTSASTVSASGLAATLLSGTHRRSSRWAGCHVLMSGGMAAMLATML